MKWIKFEIVDHDKDAEEKYILVNMSNITSVYEDISVRDFPTMIIWDGKERMHVYGYLEELDRYLNPQDISNV